MIWWLTPSPWQLINEAEENLKQFMEAGKEDVIPCACQSTEYTKKERKKERNKKKNNKETNKQTKKQIIKYLTSYMGTTAVVRTCYWQNNNTNSTWCV